MYYFAYGSNMLRARLTQRVGAVSVIGAGSVPAYQLRFHKRSVDGSGKCNLFYTGYQFDRAQGVVYALRLQQRFKLDEYEGRSYRRETIMVHVGGRRIRALTYIGIPEFLRNDVMPYNWYHAFVLAGALQHGLDRRYIEYIASVGAQADQDIERADRNLQLLRQATVL